MRLINIIIPLYESQYMDIQLKSIYACELQAISLKVIYMDDGSTLSFQQKYQSILDDFQKQRSDIELCLLRLAGEKNKRNRVSAARNYGVAHAEGEHLLLIDQDTLLHRHYFRDFHPQHSVVLGSYYGYNNHQKTLSDTQIQAFIESGEMDDIYQDFRLETLDSDSYHPELWELFLGSHVYIQKRLYESLGGFDETRSGWGDEDVEFGYRISQRDKIYFEPSYRVLNISRKLYIPPYNILENHHIHELSNNWMANIAKHPHPSYIGYVLNRYQGLSDTQKSFLSPGFGLFISQLIGKKIFSSTL